MAKFSSFQNEVPKSRINIRYVKDIGGAQEKVELPLKLLLVGEYGTDRPEEPVEERERIKIDMNNFRNVMKEMNLKLSMNVANHLSEIPDDKMTVDLEFNSLKDFTPDEIVQQVPELKTMMELRSLLKDLKSRVITNRDFRRALDDLLAKDGKAKENQKAILDELSRLAPLPESAKVAIPEDPPEDDDY